MKRLTSALVIVALVLAGTAVGSTTATAAPPPGLTIPVVGSVVGGGSFVGSFSPQRFVEQNGVLSIVGTLVGTLTNAAGIVTSIVQTIALPVAVGQTTCDILHLDLGPLSLNLLGLQVNLSQIVLDITAQAGAGNLLGNLLCAVAGLLDNPSGLARVLNQILAILS